VIVHGLLGATTLLLAVLSAAGLAWLSAGSQSPSGFVDRSNHGGLHAYADAPLAGARQHGRTTALDGISPVRAERTRQESCPPAFTAEWPTAASGEPS
jgi:hypothetical protein